MIFFSTVIVALLWPALAASSNEFFSQLLHPRTQYVPTPPDAALVQLGVLALAGSVVVAWGDFDNDYHADAVVLTPANGTLAVHLFDAAAFAFVRADNLSLAAPGGLVSVHAADFDVDGFLDLLLVANASATVVFHSADSVSLLERPVLRLDGVGAPVSIVDANFDLRPDLLGVGSNGSATALWMNRAADLGGNVSFDATVLAGALPLAPLYSVLFGDVNGDCLADLMLPTHDVSDVCAAPNVCYQVFLAAAATGELVLAANDTVRLLSALDAALVDVNSDGSLDLVYAAQDGDANTAVLTVRFNARITEYAASTLCQPHPIAFALGERSDDLVRSRVELGAALAVPSDDAPVALTRMVRFGDVDLDGFVDALLVVRDDAGVARAQLWMNVPCVEDRCGSSASAAVERRGFEQRRGADVALLDAAAGLLTASFVDLGDKGRLDVLLNFAANASAPVRAATLFNNAPVAGNGFFLYLTTTNGVCQQWCSSPAPAMFARPSPVGSAVTGATFRFAYLSRTGDRVRRTAAPQVRTSYGALELPYELVGFGTADNQVDQFVLAPPLVQAGAAMQRLFDQGVFPSAAVYGWPTPRDDPSAWMLEQRLQYGSATFWLLVTVAAATALLGVVIGYFAWRESEQDSKERAREPKSLEQLNSNARIVAEALRKRRPKWVRRVHADEAGECSMSVPSPTKSYYESWSAREQLSIVTRSARRACEPVVVRGIDEHGATLESKLPWRDDDPLRADEACFQISVQYLVHRATFTTRRGAADVAAAAEAAVALMVAIHDNDVSCEFLVDLDLMAAAPRDSPLVSARFVATNTPLPDALPLRTRLIRRSWNGRFDVQVSAPDEHDVH